MKPRYDFLHEMLHWTTSYSNKPTLFEEEKMSVVALFMIFFLTAKDLPTPPDKMISSKDKDLIMIAVFEFQVSNGGHNFQKEIPYLLGIGKGPKDSLPVSDAIIQALSHLKANIRPYPGYPKYYALGCSEEHPCQGLFIWDITRNDDGQIIVRCNRWQLPQHNNATFYSYKLINRDGHWVVTERKVLGVS